MWQCFPCPDSESDAAIDNSGESVAKHLLSHAGGIDDDQLAAAAAYQCHERFRRLHGQERMAGPENALEFGLTRGRNQRRNPHGPTRLPENRNPVASVPATACAGTHSIHPISRP